MSFTINTNIASLQSQDYLRQSSDFQGKTINRVTSGLRIISSGDDAAGLAIANGFRSDQAVLTQGVRNANDGLSQLQIADGGINNISKLLDRARTLATQSASGAFTGDRSVLNSEFQSVIGEIDRQAQAIGLNTNGAFAKSLAVFIGGGTASNGISATTNGSISIDLSASTVDSKSLGLKGVQAIGVTGTDIGSGSASTKVSDIVANTNNINSEGTAGFTDFYFRGPGFGDANKIKVSVNLSGVSDPGSLVTAINSAIQAAGNSGSQSATAFKNASVTAGVNVDSQGRSQLTFNSSAAAFQAEAGDKTSNALLGNFNTGAEGADLTATVTGGAATAAGATTFGAAGAGSVVFRIGGSSLSSPLDLTLTTTSAETVAQAVSDLSSQVANNSTLKAAGISLTSATAGSPLVFTDAHGEKFTVDVSGDTQNRLGFGSFIKGSGGAFDYSTITGSTFNLTTSAAGANATLEFSLNGGASSTNNVSVDLTGGDATAATVSATNAATTVDTTGGNNVLNLVVDGTSYAVTLTSSATAAKTQLATDINTAVGANVASVDNSNHLVLTTATKGAGGSLQVLTGTANAIVGLTAGVAIKGSSRSGASVASALNASFAANNTLLAAGLQASFGGGQLTVASNNGTNFRVDSRGVSAAAAATVYGTNTAATVDTTGGNNLLNVAIDGVTYNITLTSNAALTKAALFADINTAIGTAGTASASNGSIKIVSATTGTVSSVQILAGSANAVVGFTAGTTTGTAADLGFGTAGATFAGNTASAAPTTAAQIDAGGLSQSSAFAFTPVLYGADDQTITLTANDGGGAPQSKSITLKNDATSRVGRSIDESVSYINTQLQQSNNPTLQSIVAVKENVAGVEKIKFLSTVSSFKVSVGTNANGNGFGSQGLTDASTLAAGGSTADISAQGSAVNAVTSLSNAISALGRAQAVVGRGQNQFNYAINLAQSQLSNLAAAESRIRDADLAAEAANLTKSQILLQAGIAALAQANSAPQQVLSLLRG